MFTNAETPTTPLTWTPPPLTSNDHTRPNLAHQVRQKNPGTWKQLSTEQQDRLTKLGVQPAQAPPPAPTTRGAAKGPTKAQWAFQRGLTALAQWVEREGAQRPVPRGAVVELGVDGEAEPVSVRLGVWVSNTRARRDKLTGEQLDALAELGVDWAR
ncbi:helicase associated domain-containing protein [Streptomyces flaveolus]|uniref:helicase associated domain-containing protein n=1 Tax=Streptomyces flaveolus TaxID=67297 RepID=UPI0036F6C3A7